MELLLCTAARRAVGLVARRGRDEPAGGGIEVMTTHEKGYTTDLKTTGIASTGSDDEVVSRSSKRGILPTIR